MRRALIVVILLAMVGCAETERVGTGPPPHPAPPSVTHPAPPEHPGGRTVRCVLPDGSGWVHHEEGPGEGTPGTIPGPPPTPPACPSEGALTIEEGP